MHNFRHHFKRIALMSALTLSVTACINIPYRAPVQQGNVIEANRAGMIRAGMTKQQVADIAGSPVVYSLFHSDRWDYVYRLDQRNKPIEQKRVTIWFANGIVTKVEHSDFNSK